MPTASGATFSARAMRADVRAACKAARAVLLESLQRGKPHHGVALDGLGLVVTCYALERRVGRFAWVPEYVVTIDERTATLVENTSAATLADVLVRMLERREADAGRYALSGEYRNAVHEDALERDEIISARLEGR